MRIRAVQPVGHDFSVRLQRAADKNLRQATTGATGVATGTAATAKDGWIRDRVIRVATECRSRTHATIASVSAATPGCKDKWVISGPARARSVPISQAAEIALSVQ